MLRLARFLRAHAYGPPTRVLEREVVLATGDGELEATVFEPARGGPRPGWVVLHGITVPGRRHPGLRRFVRALASSGAVVLIPEIPSWQRLRIDPAAAETAIAAAARHLSESGDAADGGVGVIGFSFGATQALVTAAGEEARGSIRSVVGFGGYCDLGRTVRFMMVGEHEWNGARYRADPDPYGRWIVSANYLTRARGYAGAGDVARAAAALAAEAGAAFVYAGDPSYDRRKRELRAELAPGDRELWDLIAPPSRTRVAESAARELGDRLVEAALEQHPQLEPRPFLARLDRPVVLVHGRADALIPFTETLRLRSHIDPRRATVAITRLFAHSRAADRLRWHEYPLEGYRYLRILRAAIA